jgi:hypothetical protein
LFLLWLFWRWDLANYLSGLASVILPISAFQVVLQAWATGAWHCVAYFWNRALLYARSCLDCYPIYASHVVDMTSIHHHIQFFIGWDGILLTICLGQLQSSASEVARLKAWATKPGCNFFLKEKKRGMSWWWFFPIISLICAARVPAKHVATE